MVIIKSHNKYLYIINSTVMEEELCSMEVKALFHKEKNGKYLFTDKSLSASVSPYIKMKIKVQYEANEIKEIVDLIKNDKLAYDNFKVNYIKSEWSNLNYDERLNAIKDIGFVITGFPDIHNPEVDLAVINIDGKWIFGEMEKNDLEWMKHNDKPHSYSNALTIKVARAIVNVAVGDKKNIKLIDPCCGIGTVVIEALDLGIDVKGYEISKLVASNARDNVKYFGYDRDTILQGDMHKINEKYDVAIVDIPYGLFSPITLEEQIEILKTTRRISNRAVIVTLEDMNAEINNVGFNIVDICKIVKGSVTRYINICE